MKKPLRIAVNGLGRIGRMFIRIAWDNPAIDIVAANSPSDPATYAHLLKYDSLYGTWDKEVAFADGAIVINGKKLPVSQIADKDKLNWKDAGIDMVIDASGKYRKRADAASHLNAGAPRVVVTAPMEDPDAMFVVAVNENTFDPEKHKVISAASCTSVCTSFTMSVLSQFGIVHGYLTTVHAVTGDQNLNDGAHKDLRRARAATESIIPTSTGVTQTIDKLFPALAGKMSGISLRVPVTVPSLLSLALELKDPVTKEALNAAFEKAAGNGLAGHLGVSNLPLVSIDFKQNPNGAIVDLLSTTVVDGRMANVLAWYDNEWGYTCQVVKLLEKLAEKL